MSKVIKAIIVATIIVGASHVSMAAEPDNNMATLEEIKSETALTEAQIGLFEKKQKLEELRSGKSSTADLKPMVMPTPIPTQFGNGFTPSNLAPGIEGGAPAKIEKEVLDEVLGVVGVGGKYKATIRTGAGTFIVSQGDKISGGEVATISLDKVVLKKANKKVSLPFADQKS